MLHCLTYIIGALTKAHIFGLFCCRLGCRRYMRAYNFYEVYGNFSTYIDIGYQPYCIYYLKVGYVLYGKVDMYYMEKWDMYYMEKWIII